MDLTEIYTDYGMLIEKWENTDMEAKLDLVDKTLKLKNYGKFPCSII